MSDTEPALLAKSDPNRQESLDSENIADPLDGEQTWPTDEELAESAAHAGQCTTTLTVCALASGNCAMRLMRVLVHSAVCFMYSNVIRKEGGKSAKRHQLISGSLD